MNWNHDLNIAVALLVRAWIEIMTDEQKTALKNVALLVSAWIEIVQLYLDVKDPNGSHSLWVRGLKYSVMTETQTLKYSRTPCECVDWNIVMQVLLLLLIRRTPCECVDWNSGDTAVGFEDK